MSAQSKLFAVGAILCFVIGFLLRGVETFFVVALSFLGVVLIFISFAYRE